MADKFHDILARHFRFRGRGRDNLPYLATPPHRDGGREALALALAELGVRRGAEIGVRRGGSALVWLKANPQLELACIDPWQGPRHEPNYAAAQANLAEHHATLFRATSMEALALFDDDSLDFVHIDGNHEYDYAAPDVIFWSRKLRPGGIIACHDYLEFHKAGVMEAVKAYTHCHHIDPWYVTRDRLPTAFWQRPASL